VWSIEGIILARQNKHAGKKTVPLSLCPPNVQCGLVWKRTRASMLRPWPLTAWAMRGPLKIKMYINCI
jgi:hypothetical protein